ncbi:MAG TPA: nucleoside permease [Candidatus Hydrogenedentes bacterium]|nr:nucleoside permease [Candidatus Hydrogenedentota bacterium]
MSTTVRVQLSIMMFIQFFVWGVWFVTLGTYLGKLNFSGTAIGSAYSTTNWGAIVAPFIIGMIADKFFSAERVMGVLHIVGSGIMWYLSTITEPTAFFFVALAYALCYMPTLSLVNAISFQQMTDPAKEFPAVRVLGTLGWIAAGLLVGRMGIEDSVMPLQMAAGASFLMGLYSFTLPNTPPKSRGKKVTVSDVLGLDALRLLKDPSFLIFVVCSLLICIPLAFYYNFTNMFLNANGVENAAGKQTFGQMSEVAFMVVMPVFFMMLGVKRMLLIGMVAWAVRYFFFAYGNADSGMWMWYIGILLHGICYDFFFVTGQLYVDKKAPESVRASAQGFIGVITYGVGMVIGSIASGRIVDAYKLAEPVGDVAHDWRGIWLVPGIMAVIITIIFALLFRDNGSNKSNDATAA